MSGLKLVSIYSGPQAVALKIFLLEEYSDMPATNGDVVKYGNGIILQLYWSFRLRAPSFHRCHFSLKTNEGLQTSKAWPAHMSEAKKNLPKLNRIETNKKNIRRVGDILAEAFENGRWNRKLP
jgi:hypothetical protein